MAITWLFLAIIPSSWQFLINSWQFLAILGNSWQFLAILGNAWQLLAILGVQWRPYVSFYSNSLRKFNLVKNCQILSVFVAILQRSLAVKKLIDASLILIDSSHKRENHVLTQCPRNQSVKRTKLSSWLLSEIILWKFLVNMDPVYC